MTTVSERLAALKEKLEAGRTENLKAAQQEASRAAAGNAEAGNTEAGNDIPQRFYNEYRSESKGKKRKTRDYKQVEKTEAANEADGEDEDDRIRSMKRRTRAVMKTLSRRVDVNEAGEESHENDEKDENGDKVVVYGGSANVDKEALDNMVNELQDVESRRAKFRRRRKFDEDNDDITFINEGNRLFNRTLDRHFNKFDSVKEIQDNLERGTA